METKFDPTKPVQLRDGRPARVYATDCGGDFPIHGAYQEDDGTWVIGKWTDRGRVCVTIRGESSLDLVNVPEKIVRYVNMYPDKRGEMGSDTRDEADQVAAWSRIACIRVEFPAGQFDD